MARRSGSFALFRFQGVVVTFHSVADDGLLNTLDGYSFKLSKLLTGYAVLSQRLRLDREGTYQFVHYLVMDFALLKRLAWRMAIEGIH